MAFTTAQLAAQMNVPQLQQWAASNLQTQGPFMPAFTAYFTGLQTWITQHHGANPFGWDNLTGLTHVNGAQVTLQGPQQRAPFNDAFNDVRTHLPGAAHNPPTFNLFQAAQATQRLIKFLGQLG